MGKITPLSIFARACALLIMLLLAACRGSAPDSQTQTPSPVPPLAIPEDTPDPFFLSDGAGEPRSPGYWLLWNSCAPDNRAAQAAANGGRAAGWVILDDLLLDPGILLGPLQVASCQEGINLLSASDLDGQARSDDPTYQVAQALLSAQLNLAIGAELCPAVDESVRAGQVLLLAVDFNGRGDYADLLESKELGEVAVFLIEQLGMYNRGALCK
jgi:hypothetical protein